MNKWTLALLFMGVIYMNFITITLKKKENIEKNQEQKNHSQVFKDQIHNKLSSMFIN